MTAVALNQWDDLVGDLYDAVLQKEADALSNALRRFERVIDSDGCHLFGMSKLRQELFTVVTYPSDVSTETAPYYEHYMHIDPRIPMVSARVGKAERSSDWFNPRFVSGNEFFPERENDHRRQACQRGRAVDAHAFAGQFNHHCCRGIDRLHSLGDCAHAMAATHVFYL